ncbi:MAG: 4'-phosphopantetheinyl transferase superfamily protein [Prevotella sp.]|nr:4'-phosphopantetheinyl transferase superfamily protein [Prevotella sp.]
MALISIEEVCEGVRLGLWRMDEEPEELLAHFPYLRCFECPYKHSARRKEFYSVRALLIAMTSDPELCIDHVESGRPVVSGRGLEIPEKRRDTGAGWQVSISHTKGYAALMLSRDKAVGVDIEYRSDRVAKIAAHYIRPDEKAGTVEQMLVLWCAKETLYKLHSDDRLDYFEMRAVAPPNGNELMLENIKRGQQVKVHVIPAPDYVLTWAVDF